ncbi:hypothetical protein GCM10028784_27810 [Myceligenerans cantabricum]
MWVLLLAVLVMFAGPLLASLPFLGVLDRAGSGLSPGVAVGLQAGLQVLSCVIVVALVVGWRRLMRRPVAGAGLVWSGKAVLRFLVGALAIAGVLTVVRIVAVALGGMELHHWSEADLGGLPVVAVVGAVLVQTLVYQAFPEELIWRGHVTDVLRDRWSPGTVLVVTSSAFGLLHIFSQGGQETVLDHVAYVTMAILLGFACGAARLRTGGIGAAVGVHAGFHLANSFLPATAGSVVVDSLVMGAALAVVGAGFLLVRRVQR